MNKQRLEELEAFKATLEMQLNETVFLIQGYKNAIENSNDNETKADQESAGNAE